MKNSEISYCTHCGAIMSLVKTKVELSYDSETGEKIEMTLRWWKCPNKKWFWDNHDQYDDVYRGEM